MPDGDCEFCTARLAKVAPTAVPQRGCRAEVVDRRTPGSRSLVNTKRKTRRPPVLFRDLIGSRFHGMDRAINIRGRKILALSPPSAPVARIWIANYAGIKLRLRQLRLS